MAFITRRIKMKYNIITGMPMSEEIEKSRALKNIELQEISLVDKPANQKRFLFFKNEDGDELDKLLSVLESAQFDSESDIVITKAIDVLTSLDADERTAIAKTILAIVQLAGIDIDDDEPIEKIDISSLKWPSFQQQRSVQKKTEVDDKVLWPSLVG